MLEAAWRTLLSAGAPGSPAAWHTGRAFFLSLFFFFLFYLRKKNLFFFFFVRSWNNEVQISFMLERFDPSSACCGFAGGWEERWGGKGWEWDPFWCQGRGSQPSGGLGMLQLRGGVRKGGMLLTWPRLASRVGGGCCNDSRCTCLALHAHQGGENVAPRFVAPASQSSERSSASQGWLPVLPGGCCMPAGDGEWDMGLVPLRGVVGAVN